MNGTHFHLVDRERQSYLQYMEKLSVLVFELRLKVPHSKSLVNGILVTPRQRHQSTEVMLQLGNKL